tara:strand:+ start:179 stop:892 length:714 start_codon:yes stop_codon:yes gene_type:complete
MIYKFLKYLENSGKCKALVDTFGNVLVRRYFLFGVEPDEEEVESGKAKYRWFPNLWIHRIEESECGADGQCFHAHPYNTVSYIISGGYIEHFEGVEGIKRNKGDFIFRGDKLAHYIGKTDKNTMSLFFHGFRKKPAWIMKPSACYSVCDFCKTSNKNECMKTTINLTWKQYTDKLRYNEMPKWYVYNDEGKKRINRRQRACKKLGIHRTQFSLNEIQKLFQARFIDNANRKQPIQEI